MTSNHRRRALSPKTKVTALSYCAPQREHPPPRLIQTNYDWGNKATCHITEIKIAFECGTVRFGFWVLRRDYGEFLLRHCIPRTPLKHSRRF
jgi:hypothetical protein